MRVLLVEDEIRLAENVAAALRDGPGFAVDLAEDGQIGLYLAKDRCYDLIILDLMLPKLDGLSLLKKAHESFSSPAIPGGARRRWPSSTQRRPGFRIRFIMPICRFLRK